VSEGVALPLNLLGVPGDAPDFVVSAQVFSYVFTLRGDKAWKQPPSTSGAISVSPLGLHIYEVLKERGAMSAAELASELGREVTETAIQRALSELWSQMRVLPLLAQNEGATLWELTQRRFTKALKAGANAGQPTALSALISLYLAQAIAATEEEIETYLSPLTARSRVREVLRALTGARQLSEVTLEGKAQLFIPGSLPEFASAITAEGEEITAPVPFEKPKKVGTGRISSFSSEKGEKESFRGKPVKSFGAAKSPRTFASPRSAAGAKTFGTKPTSRFGPRLDGKTDSERRPFKRDGEGAKPFAKRPSAAKPSFDKPWDEDRKPRAAAPKDAFTKFRKPAPGDREPLGPREQAGLPEERRTAPRKATESFVRRDGTPAARKPFGAKSFGDRKPFAKKSFGDKPGFGAKRPYTPRTEEGGERPAFKPRSYERRDGDSASGPRKPFGAAKSFGDRKPFAKKSFGDQPTFGAKRPYTPRTEEGGERPAFKPRTFDRGDKPSFGAKRPYTPRTSEGGDRPAFKPRTFDRGDKPAFGAKRPYVRKSEGGGDRPFAKRAFKPKFEDSGADHAPVERTLPKRPHKPRAEGHENRKFNKDPWVPPTDSGEGKRLYKARSGGGFGGKKLFGGKKPGGFGAKRPSSGAPRTFSRKKPE
jgi:23S rRNA pseudouridine2605 synthase